MLISSARVVRAPAFARQRPGWKSSTASSVWRGPQSAAGCAFSSNGAGASSLLRADSRAATIVAVSWVSAVVSSCTWAARHRLWSGAVSIPKGLIICRSAPAHERVCAARHGLARGRLRWHQSGPRRDPGNAPRFGRRHSSHDSEPPRPLARPRQGRRRRIVGQTYCRFQPEAWPISFIHKKGLS
jgi:hypothetical protein